MTLAIIDRNTTIFRANAVAWSGPTRRAVKANCVSSGEVATIEPSFVAKKQHARAMLLICNIRRSMEDPCYDAP